MKENKIGIHFLIRTFVVTVCMMVVGSLWHTASAQGMTNISVSGIPPVIKEPFTDQFEQNFRNGRYQLIFTYNNSNTNPVDFRFRFQLNKNGEELFEVISEPRQFRPGAYVFTSIFQDLPFDQTFDEVLKQADKKFRNQLVQEGTIPEGSYTLNIEPIPDKDAGMISSPPSVKPFSVRYPQAPVLINPPDRSNLTLETPVFNWTPVVGMQGYTMQYDFLLVEVLDSQTPLQAIRSNRTHAQKSLTDQITLAYTPEFLPLEEGQQYAWMVRANSMDQSLPIKNEGESEIRTFTYKRNSSEIAENIKEIPLQRGFAILTNLDQLEIKEQANSIILNGSASLEVAFNQRSSAYQIGVNVQNLRIQKGSMDAPIITSGAVVANGQFFEDILDDAAQHVNLSEVRWDVGKGLTAQARLQTPDQNNVNTRGTLYLDKSGIRGTVTAQGDPLASLGSSPLELVVTEMKATFPGGDIRGTGTVRTFGEADCDVPYLSLGKEFRVGVDCNIDKDVELVDESDRLVLGMDGATGQLWGSWSEKELDYELVVDSKLGIKLKDDQYCENSANLSLSSEDGFEVDNFIPGCIAPDPTLDLGLLQLSFSNLDVASVNFDSSDNWDFDISFDAELFFPTAQTVKLPKIEDVHLSKDGIRFPKSDFKKSDLQTMRDIAIDQVNLRLQRFLMEQFTFPWFNWQKRDTGPWDFLFNASVELPDNPNYPSCLRNTNLSVQGAHIEDSGDGNRALVGDIDVQNLGSCSWAFGSGHKLNIDDLSGSLFINYENEKLRAYSELFVKGGMELGEPFDCDSGETIDLAESKLKIAGGLTGTIDNIIPQCPLNVGPYTAQVTSSSLDFSHRSGTDQKAFMDAQAELEISDGASATGDIKVDLMDGSIDSADFNIQGPFEWGIPKEDPVLTFRIDQARVTDEGFFIDGRQELLIDDQTIGATFDQLVLNWDTFEVKSGSIILDETFSFQAGIDSNSNQLDYQAALGDSTLTYSPGVLMNLAGTVTIDTLGLHTSGTTQTRLDFGGTALDSLEINYTDNFAMGLKPFGIKRGKAELFWNDQRVAFADNAGFHPDMGFFGNQFLPERLPLPTEQIAYIQLKENDQLVVNTTSLGNGEVRIETKENTPLKLILPALKGNLSQVPEVSVSLDDVRINPSTGNYISGKITANVPQSDSQFDLNRLNIPLLLKQIVYEKRSVNSNLAERLFLDGNLKLFEKDLGSNGGVSLFVESNGDVKGQFDLPNINANLPLDPNSGRVVAELDSLGGVVHRIPLFSGGQPNFDINMKGGFRINNQDGDEAASAGIEMRFDDQGLALTNFDTSVLQNSASLDLGVFGFDIDNISSLSLGYTEQDGFDYYAALDFTVRLNLPNQESMAFPLKNVEIRDDLGFVIPQQDIHGGSTPSLDAPAINLGILSLKPLAFRMPRDTVNWNTWSPGDLVDLVPKVDMELRFPGLQSTSPELSQVSITLQNLGFSEGVFTGSMLGIDRTNDPIYLPIGSDAGISIDGINGGLFDPGDGNQGYDIQLSGYFDMPSFFATQNQVCNQTHVDLNLSKEGGLNGTIQDFLPCGELELGALSLAFGQSTLDMSFSNDTQLATIAGAATADIQRENASDITANGNLTFDLLNGKVLSGNIGVNQNFDWYFPSDDSLFAFEVQSAKIDTAGLVFTGGGSMKAGGGSVSVTFNDLAFSLTDGSLSYGSAQIQNSFALDIGLNPTSWNINSSTDSMQVDPGVRLTLPPNLVLDQNGLQVDGSSGASLRYGEESYSNLDLDFVNMMIGFDPVGVKSGRADFTLDEEGEDPVRLAWYDDQGFHPDNIAGGVPLPDTLGLPSKDIAFLVLKDRSGNNLVQSSAVSGGLSISTSQPIPLVLASIEDSDQDNPQVNVSFSDIVINGSGQVVSGSVTADLSNTPLNLGNYGDYPFGLMAIHFMKNQGGSYKTYVDARMELPEGLNDMALLLEKIALGPDGFEETTLSFGSYTTDHTEGSTSPLVSHSFSNDALTMAMRGAELEFAESNSYRLSGDISSNFLKNANGDSAVVHFAADYSNSNWQFNLDTDHLMPQEVPIGMGKLILEDIQAEVDQQEFALILDGRFALAGIAGDDLEIGIEDLRVGTDGISVSNVNTSGFTPMSLDLFGQQDVMSITALDVQLTPQNDLMLMMNGSLSFLDHDFDFTDFKLGSDGTFEIGSGGVNLIDPQNSIPVMDQYFVLKELSIGIQNDKAALTASGDVTLPEPFNSTSTTSLTVDYEGNVTSTGPSFVLNETSVELQDIASLKLTGAGFEINDITTPDITLYGSAEVEIDGKTIEFGQPGSPSDWGIRYQLGTSSPGLEWNSPTNHPTFSFDASLFNLTINQVALTDDSGGSFGLSFNTSAVMQLEGISGELDLEGFQISSSGIKSMGQVTGGDPLTLGGAVSIEVGSFDWLTNTTVDLEVQDGTNDSPGSTTNEVYVEEYLSFTKDSGSGKNAVSISIPGGFNGNIDEILYYRKSNQLYLNIDGVDIELSDYGRLYASMEYLKQPNGFKLKVAGGGEITAGGQTHGIAAMGRMSTINDEFSFGIFVSVESQIPIVPDVLTLTKTGGGFFYKASNQDFEDVVALSDDYQFYNDKAPWVDKSGDYDFAIALNAEANIISMNSAYAVKGQTMILITDEWFAMDVQGTFLSQSGKLTGGMYLNVTIKPQFEMVGGAGLTMDYSVIAGDIDVEFKVLKNAQDKVIWAISGNGDLDIFGGVNATSSFIASPDGFYVDVSVSKGFDVWIISINSNFDGSIWWIYNEQFGAYVEIGFDASLFGGAASIGGKLKGALIVDNGYLLYASASAHVSVFMIFDGRVSVWVSLRNGDFDGGRGSNGAYESMIEDAKEQAQDMEDKMNEALNAAKDLESDPDIFKMSNSELAAAGARMLSANEYYQAGLFYDMVNNERYISTGTIPSIYSDIRSEITGNNSKPQESSFNLSMLRSNMGTMIDDLTQRASGVQARLQETRTAAIQWEAQAEDLTQNVINPVNSSEMSWQGDQPPSFDIKENQAATNQGTLEQMKQEFDALDQKYKAALDSISANIDRIDDALSFKLPTLSIQQGLDGNINLSQQGDLQISANMVSEAYVRATTAIDKFYGNYSSYLWSTHYWAKENLNSFENIRQASVKDVVIQASESQLEDVDVSINFVNENNVTVGSMSGTDHEMKTVVKRTARERYFHFLDASPNYTFNEAISEKNNFASDMEDWWSNDNYQSFYGNFVQRGIELWYKMPKLGYKSIRDTARSQAEALANKYQTNIGQMQGAHERFTVLVDDIYELKASMSTTLHGLLDVYIAWKSDTTAAASDSTIQSLEQQKFDLEQQLAAPQITNISYSKILSDFSNKVELDWTVTHPSGFIAENSYNLSKGTNASIFASNMISTGSDTEVTRYLFKEDENQNNKNYSVTVRARGPAGVAISKGATFQVAVDEAHSANGSVEANGDSGIISEVDDTPPTKPMLNLDLDSSTNLERQTSSVGNFPIFVPVESYWTNDPNELTFSTLSFDAQSDIAGFEYAIGSTKGRADVRNWTTAQGKKITTGNSSFSNIAGADNFAQEITIRNLNFETGQSYYLSLRSVNGDSLVSEHKELSKPIKYDDTNPSIPVAGQGITLQDVSGGAGSRIDSPVGEAPDMLGIPNTYERQPEISVQWNASSDQESGIKGYEYVVSESPDPVVAFEEATDIFSTTSTNVTINGDPLSYYDSVYVHIRAIDFSARFSDDALTYGPEKPQDPTAPYPPALAASNNGGDIGFYLLRPSVDLETDVDKYQLAMGTSRFLEDVMGWSELDMSSASFLLGLWKVSVDRGIDWPTSQAAEFIEAPSDNLSDGQEIYFQLRSLNGQGSESQKSYSGPITIDSSPPKNPSISLSNNNSQLTISVSNIQDPHSGVTKVEYKVIDTSKYGAFSRVVKHWDDFIPIYYTQTNTLSDSKTIDIFGHSFMDLEVKIRITNGIGLQNVRTKLPAINGFANQNNYGTYYNIKF